MPMRSGCIVVAIVLLGWPSAARAECKPSVLVDGDPTLVRGLTSKLASTGIAVVAIDGCPTLRVSIEQRGAQLHVRISDASQRMGERDVQDLATAAAVVESWTYQEIDAGSMPDVPPSPVAISRSPRHTSRSGFAASVVSSVGSNGGTTWVGGSIAGCARVGATCVGGHVRSTVDTRASGDTSKIEQRSYVLGAFATLDLPGRAGSWIVSPGVGLGYGYLHVSTTHNDAMNNPFDVPTSDHQLRVAVHAAVLRSLGDHVSVFADLWGDAAPVRSDSQSGPTAWLSLALGLRFEEW